MSMFGGLGKMLLGSSGGYDSGYKDRWNGLLDQWNALDYDPRLDTAQTMDDYDSQLGNQVAAGQTALGESGFGGSPVLAGTRARFAANTARTSRQKYNDFRYKKMQGLGSLLSGAGQSFYKAPTSGLAEPIGSLASGFGAMGWKPF